NDAADRIFDLNRDIGLMKGQQEALKKEINMYKGIADKAVEDAMMARGEALRAKKDLELKGHDCEASRVDRDRYLREAGDARQETE
ncbi:hypothetical protein Dimus_003926, partial [Dionaea muscipula]